MSQLISVLRFIKLKAFWKSMNMKKFLALTFSGILIRRFECIILRESAYFI